MMTASGLVLKFNKDDRHKITERGWLEGSRDLIPSERTLFVYTESLLKRRFLNNSR